MRLHTVDLRIAGFGPLFQLTLLCAILFLIIYKLLKHRKKITIDLSNESFLLVIIVLMALFLPHSWWARYISFFCLAPIVVVFMCIKLINKKISHNLSFYFISLILTLCAINNLSFILRAVSHNVQVSTEYRAHLNILRKLESVDINISNSSFMFSTISLLDSYEINYELVSREIATRESGYKNIPWMSILYREPLEFYDEVCIKDYLDTIFNIDRYMVMISVKDEASTHIDKISENLTNLGMQLDLTDKFRYGYIGVFSDEFVYEDIGEDLLILDKKVETYDGLDLSITSAGFLSGNISSIKIDNVEYSLNKRGMNLVVYDLENKRVVDSINVDLFGDENLSISR